MIPAICRTIRSLFFRPGLLQVAALCWRKEGAEPQVLLIRSLDSNRWIIPKGWPMRGKTLAEAAAIEAWEEAGVKGQVSPQPIGSFQYEKQRASGVKQPCTAQVYALHVTSIADDFPEAALRSPTWVSQSEAIARLQEPDLQELIQTYLNSLG